MEVQSNWFPNTTGSTDNIKSNSSLSIDKWLQSDSVETLDDVYVDFAQSMNFNNLEIPYSKWNKFSSSQFFL